MGVHFSPTAYSDLGEKQSKLNQFLHHNPFAYFCFGFKNLKQGKNSSEGFFLPISDHVNFNRETSVSVCAKMKIP